MLRYGNTSFFTIFTIKNERMGKMLFPIIKVIDKSNNQEHIVGTNRHDMLTIKDGQTISYYNLQNGEGSSPFGDYKFVGKNDEGFGLTVEFVTFEELMKIYNAERFKEEKRMNEKYFPIDDESDETDDESDDDLDKKIKRMIEIVNEVQQIYEKHNGEPNPKPPILCCNCNKETTNYTCSWTYNKHVHFACEHCKFVVMQ